MKIIRKWQTLYTSQEASTYLDQVILRETEILARDITVNRNREKAHV